MKKYFVTGLVILLPLALTVFIITFVVDLLTNPFIDVVKPILGNFEVFSNGFLFLSKEQILQYTSRGLILVLLFLTTMFLGALTRWYTTHYFINLGESILHRIPLINSIYKTSRDVIKTIFQKDSTSFKKVAMVPFPSKKSQVIGFITRENIANPAEENEELIAVFVPTTPNPTSGYLMMYPKEEVTFLEMSVEEAFKYIISCGTIVSQLKTKQWKEKQKKEKKED